MHSLKFSKLILLTMAAALFCCLISPLTSRAGMFLPRRGSVRIELGKAEEIKVSSDVTRVEIGTDKIADVVVLSPRIIRLIGKNPGSTNLIVWYGEDRAEEYEILVNKGYRVEVLIGIITYKQGSLVGW